MIDPVVIIVPVLNRPGNVDRTLVAFAQATPSPHRVLFVADDYDAPELEALEAANADYVVHEGHGCYARKINLGARSSTEPLLFTGADDLMPHVGWLDAAVAKLDGTVQVVGTNDLGNQRTVHGKHSTHSLVTREYINDPGGVINGAPGDVLFEGYAHAWCDDEFVGTAKYRGVYAHAFDAHVEHLHPAWAKAEQDDTYEKGREATWASKATYNSRRHLWMQ